MPQAGGVRAVFLVGFMGAGKTSVGRVLARRLGWRFEDLDDRIQTRTGRSIAEIFLESGEAEFRRIENSALRDLLSELSTGHCIVGLGGGALLTAENRALIESSHARVVFLDGPVDELFRRCQQEQRVRPLLQAAKRFRDLYEQRRACYETASCRIDSAGKDVDTVATEVACSLGLD